MTVLCQSIKSGVVNLKPMGAGQGRGLEQVTVNEVAVGCGCFWMNGLAPFHPSLTYYMILLLKLWMVSLPLASHSGNCPSLLVLCSSKRKQMLSQYSSYRFSQPFILKFPPFLWLSRRSTSSRCEFLSLSPCLSSITLPISTFQTAHLPSIYSLCLTRH